MSVEIHAIAGIPDIKPGDDLGQIIVQALRSEHIELRDQDILVIAHKVVSKSEGQIFDLEDMNPTDQAKKLAKRTGKDPRKVEAILRESQKILRVRDASAENEGVIIARHRLGCVSANAAIDESNVGTTGDLILLPRDPDKSARTIRHSIKTLIGKAPGVVISDTFGRPWRLGQVNVAIGLAAVPAITDLTQSSDAWGRSLSVTKPAIADELAAASGLLMAKEAKTPVILFRGVDWQPEESKINDLIRLQQEDLF